MADEETGRRSPQRATSEQEKMGRQLRAATGRGEAGAVEELLGAGAPVDAGAEEAEATALLTAAQVKGQTALMHAARYGHVPVVALLLAAGAAVDQAKADGATALSLAAMNGHTAVVEALLAAGAEVDKADADGRTALLWAADGGHAAAVSMLLAPGAEVDKVIMVDGVTALMRAAVECLLSGVGLLVR